MADANFPYGEVASALGGGVLVKVVDFLTGRRKATAETKSVEVRALTDTIESLGKQLKDQDERLNKFGDRLEECHAQHEECEKGRREDRREIESLKSQVAQLMRGEVPTYQPADLKRVARRRA